MSNQEAKILSWLYITEVSGNGEAAESLKQEAQRSLDVWAHRNDRDKVNNSYEEARRNNQTPHVYWE